MSKGKANAEDKIRKLEEMIAKKKAELLREKGRLSEKERKTRTRELIQIGGLAETAGLRGADHDFLLGVLLEAKNIAEGSPRYMELKSLGEKTLEERKASRKEVANE